MAIDLKIKRCPEVCARAVRRDVWDYPGGMPSGYRYECPRFYDVGFKVPVVGDRVYCRMLKRKEAGDDEE